jgi:hypothetical protein
MVLALQQAPKVLINLHANVWIIGLELYVMNQIRVLLIHVSMEAHVMIMMAVMSVLVQKVLTAKLVNQQ